MSVTQKLVLSTKQEVDGAQRKLGWFKRSSADLYFDLVGTFSGSHTSYHKDGNIFRTSTATDNRASIIKKHIPLANFHGWFQLGISMIRKSSIERQPCLKGKDQRGGNRVYLIDLEKFPSGTLNIVAELIEPAEEPLLNLQTLQPPPDAETRVLKHFEPWLVLTILGHDHNLLIRPAENGISVEHYNSRFSASRPGQQYQWEAYKPDGDES
jgi:hypothetical protein